jgi:hypothetical protein
LHSLRVIRVYIAEGDRLLTSKKAVKTALISGVTSCLLTYQIATATEEPSQALMILQYVLLACALIGLIGSLIMLASGRTEG